MAAGVAGCSPHVAQKSPGSGSASPETPAAAGATQLSTVVAVDSSGQPVNGYRDITQDQPLPEPADCTEPSPAAVSANIYRCWPAYYSADVCWPASGLDLLCLDDPWAKQLHRIRVRAALAPVRPPTLAKPVALLLDDGTRCRLRNGGAWGHRYDDLQAFYGCTANPGLMVLAPVDADPIDRSSPAWTVKIGAGVAQDRSSPEPVIHRVQTAWFAGT
ncbi:MAG: hypothetical protein K2Q25_09025 [Mycobacteriaceae bacterium]|nr:hypothetical protein [Mycobacteriaceae bacterium]